MNRREFLTLSAVGMAGAALSGCNAAIPIPVSPTVTPTADQISSLCTNEPVTFPKDFIWGAGTSAYQIEGAYNVDGKGESIIDVYTHTPGKIKNNDNGDIALDHYHRYKEDVALMKEIGLNAYRFSISWSRVLPSGRGQSNPAGLDFYDRLVDTLLEAGIQPFPTLYVWDLPKALQDEGGWTERSTVDAFAEYADLVSRRLGDRTKFWTTLNEPYSEAHEGYVSGRLAPGHRSDQEFFLVSHHLLLAHARAVRALRRNNPKARIGIVLNPFPFFPASPSVYDRREAWFADAYVNRWYLNPLAGRGYPEEYIQKYNVNMDFDHVGDLNEIATPIDFLGVNYYMRVILRSHEVSEDNNMPATVVTGNERTEMGWEVYPPGLYDVLCRLHFEYRFPAYYVTENGAAFDDHLDQNGQVHDQARISFLERHIAQAARAIQAGVPLNGYFAWSLMDNFEWAEGYSKRFGLIHIDYATLKRTLKDSALWYRDWIYRQQNCG